MGEVWYYGVSDGWKGTQVDSHARVGGFIHIYTYMYVYICIYLYITISVYILIYIYFEKNKKNDVLKTLLTTWF